MNLKEWMETPRSEENDNICLFLSSIKARLERAYPRLNVEVDLTPAGSSHWYFCINMNGNEDRVSVSLTYIPHNLSAENASAVIAKVTPEQIVSEFVHTMEKFQ